MRELEFIASESDENALVFAYLDTSDATEDSSTSKDDDKNTQASSTKKQDHANQQDPKTTSSDRLWVPVDHVSEFLAQEKRPSEKKGTPTLVDDATEAAPQKKSHPATTPALTITPKEIQSRIRQGESPEDVAQSSGMLLSQVEPFAHLILQERAHIAALARNSHPVRSDGPAALTLWEVLTTSFAARGENLNDSQWDAHKDPAGAWIIDVTWNKNGSPKTAEFLYKKELYSPDITTPLNTVAGDLVDPRFSRPVRNVNNISLLGVGTPAPVPSPRIDELTDAYQTELDTQVAEEDTHRVDDTKPIKQVEVTDQKDADILSTVTDSTSGSKNRSKKPSVPHWEDIYLSVRPANPDN